MKRSSYLKVRKYAFAGGVVCILLYSVLNYYKIKPYHRLKYTWTSKDEYLSSLQESIAVRDGDCKLPDAVINGKPWQSCYEKIEWMKELWQSDDCYAKHGVNGSICSILEYLSAKENYCPQTIKESKTQSEDDFTSTALTTPRKNLTAIIDLFEGNEDFTWMKNRIASMEQLWIKSASTFFQTKLKIPLHKKKIHVHIGLMDLGIGKNAMSGGPLGELVQWSDLISSLYILGHDIVITSTKLDLFYAYTEYKSKNSNIECSVLSSHYAFPFDIVYTDVRGYKLFAMKLPKFAAIKCRFRILDSFGTEAQYNIEPTSKVNPFGGLNLHLKQFNTMYPHTPDNTFLGFVVENPVLNDVNFHEKRDIVLVYGKDGNFWAGLKPYLDVLRRYVSEIHGTVSGHTNDVPYYVINHGILSLNELYKLLQRTKYFVGLGFPFEGPAPLEAIAMGAVFLNPKLNKVNRRKANEFFESKPTNRALTSQNPYAEKYIGEPHVYTLDISNEQDVLSVLNKITSFKQPMPYLPYEFSAEGMLERVSIHIEKQKFCSSVKTWPPISSLKIAIADKSNCDDACMRMGLICEPEYFPFINTPDTFEEVGMPCKHEHYTNMPFMVYPAYHAHDAACCFQTSNLQFSCSEENRDFVRLCPCRDYIKGQVALCRNCT
uniref:alpha-1,6-mannosylglycoprotein 6-beta-N-acetylglucosaminyltransferase A-like isoform X1 n=2 Tax=Styela clava TaxID=7725 RepID=UPI00193A5271|nr:alpha-1,6-mannosylglycoprotein 6-beta-N-acetylglucosaminyltransferase A-like isoform X1 [Styela clava]